MRSGEIKMKSKKFFVKIRKQKFSKFFRQQRSKEEERVNTRKVHSRPRDEETQRKDPNG